MSMKIRKIFESNFNGNDLYILESLKEKFLINNNNAGIIILNSELDMVEKFNFKENFYMYRIYRSYDDIKFMVYAPDENRIIYVDIALKKIFKIKTNISNATLSPIYYWAENSILMSSYKNQFYKLDFKSKQMLEIDLSDLKASYQDFLDYYNFMSSYRSIYDINVFQKSFIYENEKSDIIEFYDNLNNLKSYINKPNVDYHDIIYQKGLFCFVCEYKLIISDNKNNFEILPENESYCFLRARWLIEDDKLLLFVLSSNKSNSRSNKIIKYEIKDY